MIFKFFFFCDKEILLYDELCKFFVVKDGLLWRLMIVRNMNGELIGLRVNGYEFFFVFCFYYSLVDGIYFWIFFVDFIEFLDMV